MKTLKNEKINNKFIYGNEYVSFSKLQIGKGAYSRVFKAKDYIVDNNVKQFTYAIKEIDIIKPFTKNNFYESSQALEISILYKLRKLKSSPGYEHIVGYYDFFFDTNETLVFLVLELCDVNVF